jgi:hypothetical protein
MHGELIHGATFFLFCSGAFAWRRAHLRRRGAPYFLQLLTRRGALVRSERGLMHEEARRRAHAFMVRDFPFQSQFIFCGQICTEGGAWVEMTGSYLVANLLGGFQL